MEKRGYSEAEAAIYLGSSRSVVRAETAKGNIPVRYLGSRKLYDRDDLDRFFESLPAERSA